MFTIKRISYNERNFERKLYVLKNGEANVQILFKSIIDPLTEISNKNSNTNDLKIENYNTIEPKIVKKSITFVT